MKRRSRLNPVSKRRRIRDRDYQRARAAVYERARGFCEARYHADGCSGLCQEVHHLAGRGGDDPHRLDNLLGVSSACHRDIHANPDRSYQLGLMVSRLADAEGEALGGGAA